MANYNIWGAYAQGKKLAEDKVNIAEDNARKDALLLLQKTANRDEMDFRNKQLEQQKWDSNRQMAFAEKQAEVTNRLNLGKFIQEQRDKYIDASTLPVGVPESMVVSGDVNDADFRAAGFDAINDPIVAHKKYVDKNAFDVWMTQSENEKNRQQQLKLAGIQAGEMRAGREEQANLRKLQARALEDQQKQQESIGNLYKTLGQYDIKSGEGLYKSLIDGAQGTPKNAMDWLMWGVNPLGQRKKASQHFTSSVSDVRKTYEGLNFLKRYLEGDTTGKDTQLQQFNNLPARTMLQDPVFRQVLGNINESQLQVLLMAGSNSGLNKKELGSLRKLREMLKQIGPTPSEQVQTQLKNGG